MTTQRALLREEIRERVNRASIGAWQWAWGADVISITIQDVHNIPSLRRAKNAPSVCDAGVARIRASRIMDENDYSAAFEQYKADAEFIAHARTDIPALLDELDAMERERDGWHTRFNELFDKFKDFVAVIEPFIQEQVELSKMVNAVIAAHEMSKRDTQPTSDG